MTTPRVTLVTGGARRVGAAIVRSFAARGDAVVIHYGTSASEAESFAASLRSQGTKVHLVQADLTDAAAPAHIVDEAMRAFGKLDVVVSSASVMSRHAFDAVTPEEWNVVEAVNLRVADRYVDAFGNLAKTNNTLILPANLAEIGGLIAAAMSVIKSQQVQKA